MTQSLFIIAGALFTIILWFWAIADILKEAGKPRGLTKLTWIWVVILFPITGSLVYFYFKNRYLRSRRALSPAFNTKPEIVFNRNH